MSQASIVLTVAEPAELMAFLLVKLPQKSRKNIKTLLRDGQVWVEGKVQSQYNLQLQAGQRVEIRREKTERAPALSGLTILYEDAHLIVIDKPEGLLSISTGKSDEKTAYNLLSAYLKRQNPAHKIFIVHRLDRDTSGVMVFAKSEKVKERLQASWEPSTKERTYLAIAEGKVSEPQGTIISYLKESKAFIVYSTQDPKQGQKAVTHFEVIAQSQDFSLLKINLETGRKNQIRVHLQDFGHPIVGDKKYGASSNPIRRLGLHAWILGFVHPITNEKLRFETKVPSHFRGLFPTF
ncbi:MAG: RluA family pseudouridine synthase [Runella zeae]